MMATEHRKNPLNFPTQVAWTAHLHMEIVVFILHIAFAGGCSFSPVTQYISRIILSETKPSNIRMSSGYMNSNSLDLLHLTLPTPL